MKRKEGSWKERDTKGYRKIKKIKGKWRELKNSIREALVKKWRKRGEKKGKLWDEECKKVKEELINTLKKRKQENALRK